MKIILGGLITLITLAWGLDVATTSFTGHPYWIIRQEALYLSGLLAFALMSLVMFLATRPVWLESYFGGLDQMYRTHKWAGILVGLFSIVHWFDKTIIGPYLKSSIGRQGKMHHGKFEGLWGSLQQVAKDLGEWSFYILLIVLILALWKRFPYHFMRTTHRLMPVLYLALVFHALMWAPVGYWTQPIGWLLVLLIIIGIHASILSLTGRIGKQRQYHGRLVKVEHPTQDIVSLHCQMGSDWPGHAAGQFVFLKLDDNEAPHPYTIASADHENGQLSFHIKALGDYTRRLVREIQAEQPVSLEGPYGRFLLPANTDGKPQIWVAAGIGVTPFLAWLEALQDSKDFSVRAELHYCTRNSEQDPFAKKLCVLVRSLPDITLHFHDSTRGKRLDATDLIPSGETATVRDIWFCGPRGLAKKLRKDLRGKALRFHQEAFEMR